MSEKKKRKLTREEKRLIREAIIRAKGTGKYPTSAQQTIPYQRMFPDGICRVTDTRYSKSIRFEDINYQLSTQEDQDVIFDGWKQFINYFDSTVHIQFGFYDLGVPQGAYEESIAISAQDDDLNEVREEFEGILRSQLAKDNNSLERLKYLSFSVEAQGVKSAKPRLERIEAELLSNFKKLGIKAEPIDGKERLALMHRIFHMDSQEEMRFEWDWLAPSGLRTQDFIAPGSFEFMDGRTFRIGETFCAASYLQIAASELDDRCLKSFLDLDSSLMVTMHIDAVDQAEAIKMVKHSVSRELTCGRKENAGLPDVQTDGEAVQEHTHTADCYAENRELTCGLEEGAVIEEAVPAHAHADECYTETRTLICELEEDAVIEEAVPGHAHTDDCYTVTETIDCPEPTAAPEPEHIHTGECTEMVLVCELPEHTHGLICYSNPNADVESPEDWERSVSGAKRTRDWAASLVSVARTQIGYTESAANYQVSDDGRIKGYTRYGDWYGMPYEDWSGMFVAFCLGYANVPDSAFPSDASCAQFAGNLAEKGLYRPRGEAEPKPGDVVFFSMCGDGSIDHMGIVSDAGGGTIYTIEGDSANCVAERSYGTGSEKIIGYGVMPRNPASVKPTEEPTEEPTATPTAEPTAPPTVEPTAEPTAEPTEEPTATPTAEPTAEPTAAPTAEPTQKPATPDEAEPEPTAKPTARPATPDEATPSEPDRRPLRAPLRAPSVSLLYDDPYNLGNYVKQVTVQHRGQGDVLWQDVVDGNVQAHDDVRFKLSYEIPGGTLSETNHTLTYQAPVGLTKAVEGIVYDGNTPFGTYKISETGLITIDVNQDYIDKNAKGQSITGDIAFEASANDLETDDKGDVTLAFNEPIHIHITDKEVQSEDLKVIKEASEPNLADGTVRYTVTVTSQNGTPDTVKLNDVMSKIGLVGDVTDVEIKNGQGETVTPIHAQKNADGFSLELPKMGPGEQYTLTYTAKLLNADVLNNDTVITVNKVDVSSQVPGGVKYVDDDKTETPFTRYLLDKAGELIEENGVKKIKWKVTVNKSQINLKGWTLSDRLNNQEYRGTVEISPSPEGNADSAQIDLPYTFTKDETRTFVVTYTTVVDGEGVGSSTASNTANMIPSWGGAGVNFTTVVNTGNKGSLEKEDVGVSLNGNDGSGNMLVNFNWKVTISGPIDLGEHGDLGSINKNCWYYGDEPWQESVQWMTGAQLKAMRNALLGSWTGFGYPTDKVEIYAYDWNKGDKYQNPTPVNDSLPDSDRYGQFRILFTQALKAGETITFAYSSTGNAGDGTDKLELTNWSTINNQESDQATQGYRPVVTKNDKEDNGSKISQTTTHDINETHMHDKVERVLGWNVKVTLPKGTYYAPVVITENLPAGTKLLDYVSFCDVSSAAFH